jgi:uroporphyrinogen-III synthase
MEKDSIKEILGIVDLLSDIVVFEKLDFENFLKKFIKIVNRIVPADSCLVYLNDVDEKKLILIGSKKGKKDLLGNIKMSKGEGITGWVADHEESVILSEKAYEDKRFKKFQELPEDKFEAFLSVPIRNKDGVIGVVNIQNKKKYEFTSDQVKILESIANIISSAFSKTVMERKVDSLENKLEERKLVEKAKGILMNKASISESEAYRRIRTESMKKRKSMKDMAQAIITFWG